MPMFHFPQLRSASWIRTTSPSLTLICLDLCFMLCLSLRDFRYSPLHRFHNTSLHWCRYLSLFLKLASPSSVLSSGTSLGWPIIMAHGVKTGSWMSSSAYDTGRLSSATSTSSKTSSSSFHIRLARPILLSNAHFTTPTSLSNWPPPHQGALLRLNCQPYFLMSEVVLKLFMFYHPIQPLRCGSKSLPVIWINLSWVACPCDEPFQMLDELQLFGLAATPGGQLWLSCKQITKCMLFLLSLSWVCSLSSLQSPGQLLWKGLILVSCLLAIFQLVGLRKR